VRLEVEDAVLDLAVQRLQNTMKLVSKDVSKQYISDATETQPVKITPSSVQVRISLIDPTASTSNNYRIQIRTAAHSHSTHNYLHVGILEGRVAGQQQEQDHPEGPHVHGFA
jgi:hypothetical protein